ncbi:MAG: hypothetical protein RLZZ210_1116 [Pseudomonadota bacterium]|jgi:hypothetical protein
MGTQPNFEEIFINYFSKLKKVKYKTRQNSNFIHDIMFINSLISDSSFRLTDITQSKKTICIKIRRMRNEFVYPNDEVSTYSILKLSNIKSINWILGDINPSLEYEKALQFDDDDEINNNSLRHIDKLFIGEKTYSRKCCLEIILQGYPYGWQLRIEFHQNWHIELKDLELAKIIK